MEPRKVKNLDFIAELKGMGRMVERLLVMVIVIFSFNAMNKFLEFKDSNLKEEYRRHVHHEVIICRKQFLFFFYAWHVLDFCFANYLSYRSGNGFTYMNVIYSGIVLVIKFSLTLWGFRSFLKSHRAFAYIDYFFVAVFAAASVYSVYSLTTNDSYLYPLWNGFRMTILLIFQTLTIRHGKFRTIYFILFAAGFAGYCIYQQQYNIERYLVDLVYIFAIYAILNYTLELSFKQNFMEKYLVSIQETVWEKIMNTMPEGMLIIDRQFRAQFCNQEFMKFIEVDESGSGSFFESLCKIKDVKLRADSPDLHLPLKHSSTLVRSPSIKLRAVQSHNEITYDKRREEMPSHSELDKFRITDQDLEADEEFGLEGQTHKNLKGLVKTLLDKMPEYKAKDVGWNAMSGEPKFFVADATLGERQFEIKLGFSHFNDSEALILIFTETTQSYKVARLQDKDNFKTNLLASISHELRTPLNGTISMIELAVSSGNVTPEIAKDFLLPALSSVKRLEYFVKDVSDFNDLYQDKFNLCLRSWEIRPLIEGVVQMIRIQAESKGLVMKVNISEDIPTKISTDAERMCQILINLLSNSLRFTKQGTITLDVYLEKGHSHLIYFDVIDTGIGMSESDRERLLNLIASGDLGKVSQSSTGASLGICISNALARRLGNGLRLVSSELKKGTNFQFTINDIRIESNPISLSSLGEKNKIKKKRPFHHPMLPKRTSNSDFLGDLTKIPEIIESMTDSHPKKIDDGNFDHEEFSENSHPLGLPHRNLMIPKNHTFGPSIDAQDSSGNREESPLSQNNKIPQSILNPRAGRSIQDSECSCPEIFIVDDEQINHIALDWILRKINIKFEAAYNGIEALKLVTKLNQRKCSCGGAKLMLLDLGMPEMDGYETASRLKNMMLRDEIKGFFLVACTAYVGDDVKKKCVRAGFDDFVNKPLTIDKVRKLQQKYAKKFIKPQFVN